MAAVHLSRLQPSRQRELLLTARTHQVAALPVFRAAVKEMDEQNWYAVIAFSKGMLWASFASPDAESNCPYASNTNDDWLPEWFHLLCGSCLLVDSARGWIKDGPFLHHTDYLDDSTYHAIGPESQEILNFISYLSTENVPREEQWEIVLKLK